MKKLTLYEKLIFILSIYVIGELYISTIYRFSSSTRILLDRIDFVICLIFITDFFYFLYKSENKSKFLKVHWIDFVASIPYVGVLRIGRFVRIIRVFRLVRSGHIFYKYFIRNKTLSILQIAITLSLFTIVISSISVFIIENPVNPLFASLTDSFWWSVITLTTVGYGDIVPITPEGKVFSILLIGMGIGLIGTFTGYITDYFIQDEEINERLIRIEDKLDRFIKENG